MPTDSTSTTATHRWWVVGAVASGIVATVYLYRDFFFTGFARLQGEPADGVLTLAISRHWPLLGTSGRSWNDLGTFYPTPNTLGYSDTFFLNGLLEFPLKLIGVNSIMWLQITLIVFTLVGYGCAVALLRVGPRMPWFLAITISVVALFGNGIYIASKHPQLVAFQLLPVVALLALIAYRGKSRWTQWLVGIAAGLLLGLATYSAFYVGFFALMTVGIVLPVLAVLILIGPNGKRGLLPYLRVAPGLIVGFVLSMGLFIYTYGPIIALGLARPVSVLEEQAFGIKGLFNVGAGNVLWGPLFGVDTIHDGYGEAPMAPTPLLLVLSVVLLAWGLWRLRQLSTWGYLGIACLIAGFVLWVSPIKYGSFFPWADTVYKLPGGSALRAIGRVDVMASMVLALGIALLFAAWWQRRPTITVPIAVLTSVMLVLLVAEQINTTTEQRVEVSMLQQLQALPTPPAECRSFLLTSTLEPPQGRSGFLAATTQAVFVSQEVRLPTWNGYPGFPAGWNMRYVGRPEYKQNAEEWGKRYGLLDSACGLDLASRSWLSPAEFSAYLSQ